jgi:hypothetical protein
MKMSRLPELTTRHHYALLGLSEPTIYDDVVGSHVPHQLSSAEHKFMLEESLISADLTHARHEAERFFSREYPNGHVYYKRSRWTASSPLHVMSINKELNQVGC